MASLTIRNLDDGLKARLRIRAAQHGRSMEEEARQLIGEALKPESTAAATLSDIALSLFGPAHGIELQLAPRGATRDLPPLAE